MIFEQMRSDCKGVNNPLRHTLAAPLSGLSIAQTHPMDCRQLFFLKYEPAFSTGLWVKILLCRTPNCLRGNAVFLFTAFFLVLSRPCRERERSCVRPAKTAQRAIKDRGGQTFARLHGVGIIKSPQIKITHLRHPPKNLAAASTDANTTETHRGFFLKRFPL